MSSVKRQMQNIKNTLQHLMEDISERKAEVTAQILEFSAALKKEEVDDCGLQILYGNNIYQLLKSEKISVEEAVEISLRTTQVIDNH